uniref:Reverse transcriptase Ty1/copia-type domain-containing protein n=1 Tax=Solanum lycopersicum TaxID=4081 RepID=A0A3Q7GJ81_SOLLC
MWQGEVLDVLFQQGLDSGIEEKKPDGVGEEYWKIINCVACGTIRSYLAREQKYPHTKETSANKLWNSLEERFLKKNSQNKLYMKRRLLRFTYVPGSTMNDHITNFNKLAKDLRNMDVTFTDRDMALMLLSSLPDEFEHLETTLLHGNDGVSLKEVCSALYSYEQRKREKQKGGEAEALVARGHWKKECPKLNSKVKPNNGKALMDSNVADCDDSDYSLVTIDPSKSSDVWLMDSACSYHMCPNREWFIDLQEGECGFIHTANNIPLTAYGVGSIQLRNHDGLSRTLTDVRYVPDLKKNLIFVGALKSNGFKVIANNGVIRICSGVLVVMKAIRRNNNMYHSQGSTVIGTAATTSNDEKGTEMTKLWCMRLGHAGGKSLKTLSDQGLLKGVTVEEVKQIDGASKQVECEGKIIFPTQGSNEETTEDFPLEGEPVEEEVPYQEPQPQLESIATSKPKRTIRKPARFIDMVACADSIVVDDISATYKDAVQSSKEDKYIRSKYDHCVYLRKLEDNSFIYLLLYVDDMLISSKSQEEIGKLTIQLRKEFEMKDLGEAKKFLTWR